MKDGLSRSEQLVGYFHSTPSLGMAYCLVSPDWHFFSASQRTAATSICTADTQTLLIKVSATVTVYRAHRRTLFFLPCIISLSSRA